MSNQGSWRDWAWERRDEIASALSALFSWLWRRKGAEEKGAGVLVIGPGGVGKSTLGRILSGQFDLLLDIPGEYDESLEVETYPLKDAPAVEIVVPPGQPHRREASWPELFAALAAGEYRGIILLVAYGYHNHGVGPTASYKDHPLYQGDKDVFLQAFLEEHRGEELAVLRQLGAHLKANQGKLWFLTLVTKQDLWWQQRAEVETHYRQGEYAAELQSIQAQQGTQRFRHELALASLVISNFTTGKGELLKANTAGYDQAQHARSLRRLIETLDALRRWETGT